MSGNIVSCTLGPGASIHFDGMAYTIFSSGGVTGVKDSGNIGETNFADAVVSAVNVGYFEVHAFTLDGSCYLFKADAGMLQIHKIG